MKDIKDLREELMRRRAAQAENAPEPKKRFNLRAVMLASLTLGVLVVAAVTLL